METKPLYWICENGTDESVIDMLNNYALPICMIKIILKRKDLKMSTLATARKDKAFELSRFKNEME